MKKQICLLPALLMLSLLCGCGGAQSEQAPAPEASAWTREGYYSNEAGNMLSVTWMSDTDEPGWYVGFMNGEDWVEDSYGGILPQVGDTLRGLLQRRKGRSHRHHLRGRRGRPAGHRRKR